jgi:cobalamin-dependent methionine synthase I
MRAILRSLALFSIVTLALACGKEPNRWEAAEKRAEQTKETAAPAAEAPKVEGSQLNGYFPKSGPGGAARVFTAEKDGYVEAKLQRDGQDIATLSISQAAADALAKFDSASEDVSGFPLVTVGNNQSSVLVNKKFQVKVSSKELGAADRKALLATFDLKGLASR